MEGTDSGCGRHGRHGAPSRWSSWSAKTKAAAVIAIAVGGAGFLALCCAATMWLWNALMPGIFRLPEIGFWQALGLLVLSRLLFRGGYGHAARSHWKKRQVWKHMREGEAGSDA